MLGSGTATTTAGTRPDIGAADTRPDIGAADMRPNIGAADTRPDTAMVGTQLGIVTVDRRSNIAAGTRPGIVVGTVAHTVVLWARYRLVAGTRAVPYKQADNSVGTPQMRCWSGPQEAAPFVSIVSRRCCTKEFDACLACRHSFRRPRPQTRQSRR